MPMIAKECLKCLVVKNVDLFHRNRRHKSGYNTWCKSCASTYNKQWTSTNRERRNRTSRALYHKQIDKWRTYHRSRQRKRTKEQTRAIWLKSQYGITIEQYNKMFRAQNGQCLICTKAYERLVVDHCHKSGRIRGLLCTRCNAHLAFVEDVNLRAKAIIYLESTSG